MQSALASVFEEFGVVGPGKQSPGVPVMSLKRPPSPMNPEVPASPLASFGEFSRISVRGDVALAPLHIGHIESESIGGHVLPRRLAAHFVSVGSTPASSANVEYKSVM